MSLNSSNYMDGVPVKISEKYKPPPKVSIPQAVLNRLNITEDHYESNQFTYSFQLEKQVIKKLAEWKKMRDTERENRRERIRKYELQKCRDLEQRQKQLISSVTYPNTEDLSSDEEATPTTPVAKQETSPVNGVVERNNRLPQQSFDTILQPIVANSLSSCSTLSPSTVFNYSKINYSDFESDTSSPFDNIELKTINDLDILAQVLNDTQRHSVENSSDATPSEEKKEEQLEISNSKLEADQLQPVVNSSAGVNVEPECSVNLTTTTSSNQNQMSNYYYPTNVITNNYQMMVQQTQGLCLQQQQQQQQQHQPYMLNYANVIHHMKASSDVYLNYNCLPAMSNHSYINTDYSQQPETSNAKYDYLNGTFANNYCDPQYGMHSVDVVASENRLEADPNPKSKSKSVPDILRELKDEIRDSEIRRTRNHSQTIDDVAKRNSADSAQSQLTSCATPTSGISPTPTSFMKLSPSSQTLAKNISSMGFPLERVANIAALYGNDDKKIVEHLIPLSELLDLGFDESKISEALIKFDNNKDKALDFLIS